MTPLNTHLYLLGRVYKAVSTPVRRIQVTYVPSESPLGTQDGELYRVYPSDTGDDDENNGEHGRKI